MAPKLLGETKEDVAARKAKVAALEAAGGLVVYQGTPQQSLRKFGGATHHKALVVDDKAAIVGGRNIYHFHFAEDWNMSDMEMRLDGPIAQRIGTETLRVFDRSRRMGHGFLGLGQGGRASKDERETLLGELHALNANAGAVALAPRAEDPMVQSVVWDPTYDGPRKGPNQLTDALIETIRRAKHEVIITGNSLNPCRELEAAILDARARGVRVRVATAGPNGFGTVSPLPYINAGLRYHTFVDAGVEIYETTVREHGKMVIADREVVAFGSYNPEWHSDKTLVESMFFSSHAKITEPVIAAALETLSTANIVSKEKADQLGRWRHWKLLKLMIARIGNRYI
jgi:phosphatidylserine/phosphatidylglycerophosphate/cardiolipin synthase-like enzyme